MQQLGYSLTAVNLKVSTRTDITQAARGHTRTHSKAPLPGPRHSGSLFLVHVIIGGPAVDCQGGTTP